MSVFSTEFPVSAQIDTGRFTAEVTAWLRGIHNSRVLSAFTSKDLDADNPVLTTESGEELRMLVLPPSGRSAFEPGGLSRRVL